MIARWPGEPACVARRGPGRGRMPGKIFLLAGEPWGDLLGARLIQALRDQAPGSLQLAGVGGRRMAQSGLTSVLPAAEPPAGFGQLTPYRPTFWRRLRQTAEAVDRFQPDLVLTIASPGYALRLQRRLAGRSLVRVHYVAPLPGAWSAARAARLARDLDHLLALLPFEPAFFERHGLSCTFVGHPIVEEVGERRDGPRFRRRYGIPDEAPLLCLLPGSRRQELTHHLPVLKDAMALLWQQMPRLRVVLPTLGHLAAQVRREVDGWSVPVLVLEDREERFEAYAASGLAIAASGTVSLEVALAGLPLITIYKTGPLTGWLARRLITVPHVNLVNLILSRPAVPGLLQEDCRPERIAASAVRLMTDEQLRREQQAALAEAVP